MFTKEQRQNIVADWQTNTYSYADLARKYDSSQSNIARLLHEERAVRTVIIKGKPRTETVTNIRHKANWENKLLDTLRFHGLDDADKLQRFISEAKQNAQTNRT